MDDSYFLAQIRSKPKDGNTQLVYADWLMERNDPRGDFLRYYLGQKILGPDHPFRPRFEEELSHLRKRIDKNWLAELEPERAYLQIKQNLKYQFQCNCLNFQPKSKIRFFHLNCQDTECDAWNKLLEYINKAAKEKWEEFNFTRLMSGEDRIQIQTLPSSIQSLTSVKKFILYGSHLVRIPSEIGAMTNLENFDPYTSYGLHWFPYEITRCKKLKDSRVSTRAIYGNFKNRLSFPNVEKPSRARWEENLILQFIQMWGKPFRLCSVCQQEFEDRQEFRAWISLRVATDVLPLLVNACSKQCIDHLPPPEPNYYSKPHQGGIGIQQPPSAY